MGEKKVTKNNKDRRRKKSSAHSYSPSLKNNLKPLHTWKYKKSLGEQVKRLEDSWEKVRM